MADKTSNSNGIRRYASIDFLKCLACIAVVFIHVKFPGTTGMAVSAISRFAVPLFFAISGFFFTAGGGAVASTGRKLRHALLLSICATSALLAIALVFDWYEAGFSLNYIRRNANALSVVRFFITNAPPSPLVHLWFVWALVYCYAFALVWFGDGKRMRTAGPIGFLLLAGMSLVQEFRFLLPFNAAIPLAGVKPINMSTLFVFRAMPFFLLGMWLRRKEAAVRNLQIAPWIWAVLVVIGAASAVCEWHIWGVAQFYLGSFLMVFAMLAYAIGNPCSGGGWIAFAGRELSLSVYVLHMAVSRLANMASARIGISDAEWMQWFFPVAVVALSFGLAFCLHKLQPLRNPKRVSNLLEQVGEPDRIVTPNNSVDERIHCLTRPLDDKCETRIAEIRKKSLARLDEAMKKETIQ